MATSKKTQIIEKLYETHQMGAPILMNDIKQVILDEGICLSTSNMANFFKDIIRTDSANNIWPDTLKSKRITGEQVFGRSQVFRFVEFEDAQSEPFPPLFSTDLAKAEDFSLTSLSVPGLVKECASLDETWIASLVQYTRVIETHFSVISNHGFTEVAHIQTGKKTQPDIDLLYGARSVTQKYAICCELKRPKERMIEEQIIGAAKHGLRFGEVSIPVLIKPNVSKDGAISLGLAEFKPITADTTRLDLVTTRNYTFAPHIIL